MNLREITAKIKSNPNYDPKRSYDWFRKQIQNLSLNNINTKTLTNNATFSQLMPGFMYIFSYLPKHKDKLPYWDRYPLLMPFNKDADGFIGLNLHYLPPRDRLILLAKLNQFEVSTTNHEKKLLLKWNLIKSISKYPQVQPCVKRYLYTHVKSKFLKVPNDDWIVVSQLPMQQFVGSKETTIYRDSRLKMLH